MKKIGWEKRLTAYIQTHQCKPFRPGTFDCALFFAGAVKEISGEDYAKGWRGKYKSIQKGHQLLKEKGYADHIEYAESIFEVWPSPLQAQRGDGAIVVEGEGKALGIVQGDRIYVMSLDGVYTVPLTKAVKAFKI